MPGRTSTLDDVMTFWRQRLAAKEDVALRPLIHSYAASWERVLSEITKLQSEIDALGMTPSEAVLLKMSRLKELQSFIGRELLDLTNNGNSAVSWMVQNSVDQALLQAREMSELVESVVTGKKAPVSIPWRKVPTASVEELVGALQRATPVRGILTGYATANADEMAETLIQGMILGKNPLAMSRELHQVFSSSLSRVMTLARTETMRAHREASRMAYLANSDVVTSWIWHAELGPGTCFVCLMNHGRQFPLEVPLGTHPNCRCAMLPLTVSWSGLGSYLGVDFSMVKETSLKEFVHINDGEKYFRSLSPEQQINLIGVKRFELLEKGYCSPIELLTQKFDPVWGEREVLIPLGPLIASLERKGRIPPVTASSAPVTLKGVPATSAPVAQLSTPPAPQVQSQPYNLVYKGLKDPDANRVHHENYQFYVQRESQQGFPLSEQDALAAAKRTLNDPQNHYAIRVNEGPLNNILQEGRFKSQFEIQHSNGMYDPKIRAIAERRGLDLPMQLDPSQRPIYGYLTRGHYDDDFPDVTGYGEVRVLLKYENIKDRTTFMTEDSLGPMHGAHAFPSPITDPTFASMKGFNEFKALVDETFDELRKTTPYVELQFQGQVTVQDIKAVEFLYSPKTATVKALDALQIPWSVVSRQP